MKTFISARAIPPVSFLLAAWSLSAAVYAQQESAPLEPARNPAVSATPAPSAPPAPVSPPGSTTSADSAAPVAPSSGGTTATPAQSEFGAATAVPPTPTATANARRRKTRRARSEEKGVRRQNLATTTPVMWSGVIPGVIVKMN